MLKVLNGNSNLIISHIADIDGMGSVILARKYFDDAIDYCLCEVLEVADILKEIDINNYAHIYICDLQLSNDAINYLNSRPDIVSKLKHFDHHATGVDEANPPYCNSVVTLDGRKTCGTELFYRYLLSLDSKLDKPFYKKLVEGIRANDTWDMNGDFELGRKLASIHGIFGATTFIDMILSLDDNNDFEVPKLFLDLVAADQEKMIRYIDNACNHLVKVKYKNYTIGVTISEQFRSFLGDEMCKRNPDIDFAFIINFERMSCSLRGTREDIDLGKIALEFHHDGGGHLKAAGFAIDEESIPKIKPIVDEYLDKQIKTES